MASPAQVTQACAVTLVGLHGLVPIPAYVGTCSPASFVSSTGAAFTHASAHVVSTATVLPATALVQVKDAAGNVVGTVSSLGSVTVQLPSPGTAATTYSVVATLAGVFTDYQATVTITLS